MSILLIIMLVPLLLWIGFALITAIGTIITSFTESKAPLVILGGLILLAILFIH